MLVFPSYGPESLSRVLLEAAALGVPIAAMDTGGTRDIVQHEVTGLLSTTPEALGDDVARLVADRALAGRLAAAARAHVEAQFDAPSVVARIDSPVPRICWRAEVDMPDTRPAAETLRIALVTRAIYPVHGVGGLERSTYDLARHLLPHGVRIHIVTRPGRALPAGDPLSSPQVILAPRAVPDVSLRGPARDDRDRSIDGVPGIRLSRRPTGRELVARGEVDVVIGNGASALGYAVARSRDRAAHGAVRAQPARPRGVRRPGWPLRRASPQAAGLLTCSASAVRRSAAAADCVIATDRVLVPVIGRHLGVGEDRIAIVPNAVDLGGWTTGRLPGGRRAAAGVPRASTRGCRCC